MCFYKCQKWPRIHLRASRPQELPGAQFSGFFPLLPLPSLIVILQIEKKILIPSCPKIFSNNGSEYKTDICELLDSFLQFYYYRKCYATFLLNV